MGILVIEDDPRTASAIEGMLSNAGMKVYTSDTGESGVELAGLYDYDLITLDLGLPDMTGFEVLRQMRLDKITTPVLVLTKQDSTESKIKAFGFGADDYVVKPFHREELIARIIAVTGRTKGGA